MTDIDPAPKQKPAQRTPEQRYAAAAVAQAAQAKDEMRRRDTREKVVVGALAIRRAMRKPRPSPSTPSPSSRRSGCSPIASPQ